MRAAAVLLFASLLTSTAEAQQWARQVINGGLPAVSPDGKWIAFNAVRDTTRPAQIYVISADGASERVVSPDGGSGPPQWMPDGSHLLYESARGLILGAIDGSGAQPFAAPSGGRGFVPSPDGKWLVYSAGRAPNVALTISSVDGSSTRALTEGPGMAFNGVFSPDGKRIAYARLDSTRNMQIWIVNVDGSDRRQLTKFTDADGHPQWPSWSPDGKRLAVQAGIYSAQNRDANSAHIWLVDVATGSAKKLAAHDRAYLDETPSFFPDGKRIAFQSDRTGRMEVWVMNVDGTNARQVTR